MGLNSNSNGYSNNRNANQNKNWNNKNDSNNNQNFPPKIYLGNGREKKRQNGDSFITASICIDDIEKLNEEHISRAENGKRYVKICINPYRDGANQYGNTHSISVDTYKPERIENPL
jgi:hypothetical protein